MRADDSLVFARNSSRNSTRSIIAMIYLHHDYVAKDYPHLPVKDKTH